jgi:hypothetical protein
MLLKVNRSQESKDLLQNVKIVILATRFRVSTRWPYQWQLMSKFGLTEGSVYRAQYATYSLRKDTQLDA